MPTPTGEPPSNEPSRPEFGEYATPQEQAAAIARSLPPVEHGNPVGHGTADPPPTAPGGTPARKGPPQNAPAPQPSTWDAPARQQLRSGAPPRSGAVNRFATILLLAVGLFYLLEGAPAYLAFPEALQRVFAQWGIGEYTTTPSTQAIGIAILVGQAVLWVATVLLAISRLRRRQSSWWIALLGAVATFLLTATLLAVLLVSDPAFTTYLTSV